MPFASWGGTIVKDVPKMAAAAPAMAFCARPQQRVIGLGPDRIAQAGVKAGPTRAAVVFRITGIKYQITAATMVNAHRRNSFPRGWCLHALSPHGA